MQKRLKKQIVIGLFALVCAFGVLLFCSKSSFLYPINDWYDANVYLTAGKGMARGMVMYRDLYDHKGPLIYAMHALCALISFGDFTGVFVMEVLLLAASLTQVYRLMVLYGQKKYALAAMPVMALLICSSVSFAQGDSAEELCMPFVLAALCCVLTYFKQTDERMSVRGLMWQGFLFGCVFWIKFTCIGAQCGLLLAVLLRHIRRRQWKNAFASLGWMLAGFGLSTLPWIVYFGANGAIGDWLRVYLYDNLFRYSGAEGLSLTSRLKQMIVCCIDGIGNNLRYSLPVLGGLCWMVFDSRRADRWECGAVGLSVLGAAFCTFICCKDYVYYAFDMAPFAVFGMIGIPVLLGLIFKKAGSARFSCIAGAAAAAVCIAVCPLISENVQHPTGVRFLQPREETMQYRFAERISETENATLLNYYFLDAGFYTAAGVAPNVRFYHYCNVPIDEMAQEQARYVTEEQVDYVVTRGRDPIDILEHYELIDSCKSNDDSWYTDVYLYRRKNMQ